MHNINLYKHEHVSLYTSTCSNFHFQLKKQHTFFFFPNLHVIEINRYYLFNLRVCFNQQVFIMENDFTMSILSTMGADILDGAIV